MTDKMKGLFCKIIYQTSFPKEHHTGLYKKEQNHYIKCVQSFSESWYVHLALFVSESSDIFTSLLQHDQFALLKLCRKNESHEARSTLLLAF